MKETDITNHAEDSSPYICADNTVELSSSLGEASKVLFNWFADISFKSNADTFHLLINGI